MNLIPARVCQRRRATYFLSRCCSYARGGNNARSSARGVLTTILLVLALLSPASPTGGQSLWRPRIRPEQGLSATEFSRLFRDLSEEGGYFRSDNFTSNETSYLHVVDKLRELGATGGAYIGVGPEQNFTYIAKVRPRIAFIIDIRRQALIQHLMFKAIFHLAPSRVQYLSLLLSKPVPKEKSLGPDASTSEILSVFSQAPSDDRAYTSNLAAIRKAIREDFQVQLSDADQASLSYVYKNFHDDALEIAYRMEGTRGGWFPTMKELIVQPDQHGKLGNFLASKEDYEFVRDLHRRNLIIPVVGDFAGKKALAAIGDYLRKSGLTVTAFYTSNVEQYLFQNGVFGGFVENLRKLPITEKSLFIRAVPNTRFTHPAQLPGHRTTTLLQQMTVFLRDFDEGHYQTYADMVMTHYIAAESSQ
ncbi:MAG: hypothetical protein DMF60_09720 [Acidobacteria bacterium]|nr:MAG: hypothetical protein DMF60_09720 [Acidobacteriota bacterium]